MDYSAASVHPGLPTARRKLLPVLEQHQSPFASASYGGASAGTSPCTPSRSEGAEQPEQSSWELQQPPFYAGKQDPATAAWRRDLTTAWALNDLLSSKEFLNWATRRRLGQTVRTITAVLLGALLLGCATPPPLLPNWAPRVVVPALHASSPALVAAAPPLLGMLCHCLPNSASKLLCRQQQSQTRHFSTQSGNLSSKPASGQHGFTPTVVATRLSLGPYCTRPSSYILPVASAPADSVTAITDKPALQQAHAGEQQSVFGQALHLLASVFEQGSPADLDLAPTASCRAPTGPWFRPPPMCSRGVDQQQQQLLSQLLAALPTTTPASAVSFNTATISRSTAQQTAASQQPLPVAARHLPPPSPPAGIQPTFQPSLQASQGLLLLLTITLTAIAAGTVGALITSWRLRRTFDQAAPARLPKQLYSPGTGLPIPGSPLHPLLHTPLKATVPLQVAAARYDDDDTLDTNPPDAALGVQQPSELTMQQLRTVEGHSAVAAPSSPPPEEDATSCSFTFSPPFPHNSPCQNDNAGPFPSPVPFSNTPSPGSVAAANADNTPGTTQPSASASLVLPSLDQILSAEPLPASPPSTIPPLAPPPHIIAGLSPLALLPEPSEARLDYDQPPGSPTSSSPTRAKAPGKIPSQSSIPAGGSSPGTQSSPAIPIKPRSRFHLVAEEQAVGNDDQDLEEGPGFSAHSLSLGATTHSMAPRSRLASLFGKAPPGLPTPPVGCDAPLSPMAGASHMLESAPALSFSAAPFTSPGTAGKAPCSTGSSRASSPATSPAAAGGVTRSRLPSLACRSGSSSPAAAARQAITAADASSPSSVNKPNVVTPAAAVTPPYTPAAATPGALATAAAYAQGMQEGPTPLALAAPPPTPASAYAAPTGSDQGALAGKGSHLSRLPGSITSGLRRSSPASTPAAMTPSSGLPRVPANTPLTAAPACAPSVGISPPSTGTSVSSVGSCTPVRCELSTGGASEQSPNTGSHKSWGTGSTPSSDASLATTTSSPSLSTPAGTPALHAVLHGSDSGALAQRLQLQQGVVIGSVTMSADVLRTELGELLSAQDASFARAAAALIAWRDGVEGTAHILASMVLPNAQELAGRLGIKESELEAIFGTTQAALEDVMSLMQQIKESGAQELGSIVEELQAQEQRSGNLLHSLQPFCNPLSRDTTSTPGATAHSTVKILQTAAAAAAAAAATVTPTTPAAPAQKAAEPTTKGSAAGSKFQPGAGKQKPSSAISAKLAQQSDTVVRTDQVAPAAPDALSPSSTAASAAVPAAPHVNMPAAAGCDQDCDISTTAAKQARMDQQPAASAVITTIPFVVPISSAAHNVGTHTRSYSAASNDGMLCLEEEDPDNATDWGSISPAKQLGPGGADMDWPWSLATGSSGSDSNGDDDGTKRVQLRKSASSPSVTFPPSPSSPPPVSALLGVGHYPSPGAGSVGTASDCVTGAASGASTPGASGATHRTASPHQAPGGVPPVPASKPQAPEVMASPVTQHLPDDHVPFGIAVTIGSSLGSKRPPSSPQLTLGAAAVKYPRLARSDTSPEPCLARTSVHLLSSSSPPSPAAGGSAAADAIVSATGATAVDMGGQAQHLSRDMAAQQLASQSGPQAPLTLVEHPDNKLSFTSQLLVEELVAEAVSDAWDASLTSTPAASTHTQRTTATQHLEVAEDSPLGTLLMNDMSLVPARAAVGGSTMAFNPLGASSLGSIGSSFLHEDPAESNKENLPPPGHAPSWAPGSDCAAAAPRQEKAVFYSGAGSPVAFSKGEAKEEGSQGRNPEGGDTPTTPSSGLLPVSYDSEVYTPTSSMAYSGGGGEGYEDSELLSSAPTIYHRSGLLGHTGYTATTDASNTDMASSDGSTALGSKLVAVSMVHAWSGSGSAAHGLDHPGPVDHNALGPGRNLMAAFEGSPGNQPGGLALDATTMCNTSGSVCGGSPGSVSDASPDKSKGEAGNGGPAVASPSNSPAAAPAATSPGPSDGPGSGSRPRSRSMFLWHWADAQ